MVERLDIRLIRECTEKGRPLSREKAKELIQSGCVLVNGAPAGKAGQSVKETDVLELSETAGFWGGYSSDEVFVSRGGHKLAKALNEFHLSPEGLVCLDAGASTGGFSDCLLQRGAAHIYAVDVGHGQFHEALRKEEKITVQEGKNVRYLSKDDFPCQMDLIAADLSYISLSKVLPALSEVLKEGGTLICLVKPQFEAGPGAVDKHGVIKSPAVQKRVLEETALCAQALGLCPRGFTYSPIRGPEGNIEFLMYAVKEGGTAPDASVIAGVVEEANRNLRQI